MSHPINPAFIGAGKLAADQMMAAAFGRTSAAPSPAPTKTIHRYEVPVDGQWHEHKLTGHILHVEARRLEVVEFWAHHIEGNPAETVSLRVYGTGHDIPIASVYRGTAIAPGGRLVWHLIQAVDAELYEQTTAPALAAVEQ